MNGEPFTGSAAAIAAIIVLLVAVFGFALILTGDVLWALVALGVVVVVSIVLMSRGR